MKQITISDITVNIIRKDIKNIHLAVYPPSGRVRLAAPVNADDDAIRLFLVSKLGWIKRNQKKIQEQIRLTQHEYKDRESHYLFGKRYLLKIVEVKTKPFVIIRNKKEIELYISADASVAKRRSVMNTWYREQLKAVIPELLEKWETRLGVTIKKWQIKQMKTKWGSCTTEEKHIWLNLELAQKPVQCIEYILLHEMIHLKERHHNKRFEMYLDTYMPNWKALKMELNSLPVSHAEWNY